MFFKVRNISILIVLTLKNIVYKASIIGILMMLALYFMFFKAKVELNLHVPKVQWGTRTKRSLFLNCAFDCVSRKSATSATVFLRK